MHISTPAAKGVARHTAPLALSLATLWLLRDHLRGIDVQAILSLFQGFDPDIWALAVLCTALSLLAVGGYDVLIARQMRLPISDRQAFAAGWRATAIAQTLGFGLITGALVRWRLLGLSGRDGLWRTTKLTGLVTASFFYGWLVVAGGAAILSPGLPDQIWWLGLLAVWIGCCVAVLSLRASPYGAAPYPPLAVLGRICGLTFLDTAAAALVIFCFLPDGYMPFLPFYLSFLIAYSIGMLSGVPGGVGPFEICLVTLIAPADATPLLAAVLGYRTVYFVLPAVVAGASLITPPYQPKRAPQAPAPTVPGWPAEATLLGQGALELQLSAKTAAGGLSRETLNCEIYLRDPIGPDIPGFLAERKATARRRGRRLVLYKCTYPVARAAQQIGLLATPVASEAVLSPPDFSLDGKARAGLRRKLRKSEKAGVHYVHGAPRLTEMEDIDRKWQARCGRARGFSVGQFCRRLVRCQAVFTAYRDGAAIAFITFHISENRWVLDLMRSTDGCPDGTMQGLVVTALRAARTEDIAELSLCSVPFFLTQPRQGRAGAFLQTLFKRSASAQGLWRFKSGFAPKWRTEYFACDGPAGLVLGVYDLGQLITAPPLLPSHQKTNPAHEDYDNYEFASVLEK